MRRVTAAALTCALLVATGALTPAAAAPAEQPSGHGSVWSFAFGWLIDWGIRGAGDPGERPLSAAPAASADDSGSSAGDPGATESGGPDHGPFIDPDG